MVGELVTKKKAWFSKTVWVNAIMGIIGIFAIKWPVITDFVSPEILLTAFGFINIFVRGITKGAVEFS